MVLPFGERGDGFRAHQGAASMSIPSAQPILQRAATHLLPNEMAEITVTR